MPSEGKGQHEPGGPFIQLGKPQFAYLALIMESFVLLCSPPPVPCPVQPWDPPRMGPAFPKPREFLGAKPTGERAATSFSTLGAALGPQVSRKILHSQVPVGCNNASLLGR